LYPDALLLHSTLCQGLRKILSGFEAPEKPEHVAANAGVALADDGGAAADDSAIYVI
jgi:hypothetical protein